MNWSPEQSAIFDFYRSGKGNATVKARAGTGKTTTIKEAFSHAPESLILYAVFNKKNQREAQDKITDSRVDVRTLHSLGYLYIKRFWRDAKPDNEVEFDRVNSILRPLGLHENKELVISIVQLVGFLKNTTINTTQQEAYEIAEQRDVLLGDPRLDEKLVCGALASLELAKVKDERNRISFDDMVWLPVAMNWVYPKYEMVTIDEAQDMNMPQLVMARQSTKGRVVVVGDDRQAIYGFRGAVQDSMQMMKITLRAKEFGLTTTYRCPKSVVKLAAEIVPDYHAAPSAPEGTVCGISADLIQKQINVGDAILSRLNAPLMPQALSLIRAGIPARIEGRDIAKQLMGMVRTLKASSVPDFMKRIETWLDKQIQRLEKTKNAEKKIETAQDIAETLKALAQDAKGMPEVEKRIDMMFQDTDSTSKPCVILSSVHKAKGLEWSRVWLLSDTFRRGKGIEEDNIYYVAVTRAKSSLFLVGGRSGSQDRQLEGASNCAPVSPANTIDSNSRLKISVRLSSDEIVVQGMIPHEVGNVVRFEGIEYVCHNVNDCNARFTCLQQPSKRMTLSRQTERQFIIRRMDEQKMKEFSAPRKAGAQSAEQQKQNSGTESDSNNMATKTKAVKSAAKKSSSGANKGIKGAAEYVRMKYNEGMGKKEIFAAVLERWPAFNHDAAGLESRYNTAERIAKAAKVSEKSAPAKKTPAKAAAKKSSPPPRPAKKEATPAPAAASTESAPPPRPSST